MTDNNRVAAETMDALMSGNGDGGVAVDDGR